MIHYLCRQLDASSLFSSNAFSTFSLLVSMKSCMLNHNKCSTFVFLEGESESRDIDQPSLLCLY